MMDTNFQLIVSLVFLDLGKNELFTVINPQCTGLNSKYKYFWYRWYGSNLKTALNWTKSEWLKTSKYRSNAQDALEANNRDEKENIMNSVMTLQS